MSVPTVSVIVPCYNAARFLGDAVASILAQRHPAIEILIVDDGSTDGTPETAAALGPAVTYLRKVNGGAASARNWGLRHARGEFFAFLDADDLWPEGKLERQLAQMEADSELDVVSGRIRYVPLPGALWEDYRFDSPDQTVTHIHLGAALYRRRAFERIGMFDESLRIGEDQDWFLRAREAGLRITILPDVTLLYRLHDSNITRGAGAQDLALAEIVHRSLQRRRKQGGVARALPKWSSLRGEGDPQ